MTDVKEDDEMVNNTKKVLDQMKEYNVGDITERQILKILKLQQLVREYKPNANNN